MMISFAKSPTARRVSGWPLTWALSLLVFLALPVARGHAQKQYVGTLSYTMAQPSGDASDFANNFSWLGFSVEGDWFIRDKISAGFIAGWQEIYKEEGQGSYTFSNGTVTGARVYKHLGSLPLLARARYWTGTPGDRAHAFAGLGVGTYWMKQTVDAGIYTADEDHWHFGVAPEIGVLVKTGYDIGWTLNARYNYPISTGDYLAGKSASWSYWGFGIGVSYTH
jgi:hypothetical protein